MADTEDERADVLRRKAALATVVAVLLATLAWIDGRQLDTTGRVVVGRERSVLEGLAAEGFVAALVAAAVGCAIHAIGLAYRSRRRTRGDRRDA